MPPCALTLAWLALAGHAGLPEPPKPAAARAEAADVVWRYETGG